jgi:hypothetical protein
MTQVPRGTCSASIAPLPTWNGIAWKVEVEVDPGHVCPTCGHREQVYNRTITAASAAMLVRLHRLGDGFHHINAFSLPGGSADFAKLRHWGLVKNAPNVDPTKKTSGMWATTKGGRLYVAGDLRVPRVLRLSTGDRPVNFAGDAVDIHHALRSRFNYADLRAGRA